MALVTVTGIVTRYVNYRDNDRILTIFTRELGLVDVSARGCRRQNSPLMMASQPFVYGEFVLFCSKDKYSLNSFDMREAFYVLRDDVNRFLAGMYVLALVNAASKAGDPQTGIFELLYYTLSYMAYSDCDPMDIALCFLTKLLDAAGYRPTITICARCGTDLRNAKELGFSPESGGAVCAACMYGENSIDKLSLEAIRRMLMLPVREMNKVKLPERVRAELKILLNCYAEKVFDRHFKPFELL